MAESREQVAQGRLKMDAAPTLSGAEDLRCRFRVGPRMHTAAVVQESPTDIEYQTCELSTEGAIRAAAVVTMLGLLLVGSVAFSSRATSLRVRAPQPRAALVTAILTAAADDEIAPRLWLVKVRAAFGLGQGLGLVSGPIRPRPCPWRGAGLSDRTQGPGPGIAFAS